MNTQAGRHELDGSKENFRNNNSNKQVTALRNTMTQRELGHKIKELEKYKRMVKDLNEKIKEFEKEINLAQSPHKHDDTTHNLKVHHQKRTPMVSRYTLQQFQKAAKHKHAHTSGKNAH